MTENTAALLFAAIGFTMVAAVTLFFSSRRRLFIRTFARPEELRDVILGMPRDNATFRRGMRSMALLQFSLAACLWIAFFISWLW